jgi:ectoine hydroxylase-related dioxygenase (phytanoyl-CoA dioxygenase family)
MTSTATRVGPSGLTRTQRQHFDKQGYLVVRGLFAQTEIDAVRTEAERLVQRTDLIATDNLRCRWQNHVDTGACLFECFDPVIDLAPECARLARDPRLLHILAAIYEEPAHLFKDKLILKPSGAVGYDLHQDYISWPSFPHSFITAAVAIDPCGPGNGCTEVFPGVHRRGYLSPADGDYHACPESSIAESPAIPLELEPGDVALFGCLTPHRSGPNRSPGWRRLLYLSYNADSEGGDCRDAHYREFHAWLKVKYAQYGKTNTYFR